MAVEAKAEERKGVIWDLQSFFPEFNGKEMLAFKEQLKADIAVMQEKATALGTLSPETAEAWEELVLLAEDAGARLGHVWSYVGCLGAADAANEAYSLEEAALRLLGAAFTKYEVDLLRALKTVSDEDFNAFLGREKLAGAEHHLRRAREEAQHTMERELEMLATDLNVDGLHSWGQLYDTLSGKLEFEMIWPDGHEKAGTTETIPISQWRSLMSDVNRDVGKAAFDGGNRAWAKMEDTCAAALNAIAGVRLTLNKYRGIDDFLYTALFQSSIQKETLDAMYEAIHANIEIAREIFRAKAGTLDRRGIYWFERESPLVLKDAKLFSWDEGVAMVDSAFVAAYPALADYYKSFLAQRWLESEVRPGKRPGAFCTGSEFNKEQRVFMTFNGALGDVSTMAHEVGHAWHSHLLKDMRPVAQQYPMTLAETASIFAEHILAEGVYRDESISDAQKLLMLDSDLCGAAVLLLDITVRFEFEKAFHEERQNSEVSVSRLKELMVETQRRVWGDALEADGIDPLFWASKLHFYITGVTFYNFPYTFGFLLARSLFTLFKQEDAAFLPKYEEFLRLTGSDVVEGVIKRSLGANAADPEFWAQSVKGLEEPLKLYKSLLAKL